MPAFTRHNNRSAEHMRPIQFELSVNKHAEGSCLVSFGDTKVLCMATVEEKVPYWLKGSQQGWITAEYGMLPRATGTRTDREAVKGRQTGRTMEISRLIGRSLRSVVNLKQLGERTITIDCDVLQADGGTRTAAITGGYIALHLAVQHLLGAGKLTTSPLVGMVAAISCGVVRNPAGADVAVVDLDYAEDSSAIADGNFVINEQGNLIEIQTTAEQHAISDTAFLAMLSLAKTNCQHLIKLQKQVIYKG